MIGEILMKINWRVRIKNKSFWLAIVPAFLLLAQTVSVPFGYNFDFAKIGTELTAVINAVFALLAILGVVVDPTVKGITDSNYVMTKTSNTQSPAPAVQAPISDGSTVAINPTEGK
jgi:phi LC3 family holin